MANTQRSVSRAENDFWTYLIGFKVDHDMVSDVRVRRAFNLAIDQKAITEAVTFGSGEPADTMLRPGILDSNGKLDKAIYGEHVNEANRLLDETGWKKGPDGFRYKDGKKLAPVICGIAGFFKEVAEAWREICARLVSICRASFSIRPSPGGGRPRRSSMPSA